MKALAHDEIDDETRYNWYQVPIEGSIGYERINVILNPLTIAGTILSQAKLRLDGRARIRL